MVKSVRFFDYPPGRVTLRRWVVAVAKLLRTGCTDALGLSRSFGDRGGSEIPIMTKPITDTKIHEGVVEITGKHSRYSARRLPFPSRGASQIALCESCASFDPAHYPSHSISRAPSAPSQSMVIPKAVKAPSWRNNVPNKVSSIPWPIQLEMFRPFARGLGAECLETERRK
jgi:hypothetical protein